MKILLAICLVFFASAVEAAVAVTQANVESSGSTLLVTVSNIDTNGGFNFGFTGTNNIGGTVTLDVWSPGYANSGATNAVARRRGVVVTRVARLAYPYSTSSASANDITNSGSDAVIRLWLSDMVYTSDVVSNVTFSANWYSNSTPAQTFTSVVNQSTAKYPKVIGHFAVENRRPVNGLSSVEIALAHKYGIGERDGTRFEVARVTVTATGGTSGHVESGSVTNRTRSQRSDGRWVYSVPLDLSVGAGFTRGEAVTINFTAYPWLGDSTATLDAMADAGAIYQLTPLTWTVMDKMIAVVDPASGNDSSGVASTTQGTADASPCQTWQGAAVKIAAANNSLYSLNRLDGGEIQLKAGTYRWDKTGAQATANGYFTITRHGSATQGQVIFDANAGDNHSQYGYQRFYDFTINRSANAYIIFAGNPNVLVVEKVNMIDAFGSWYSGDTGTDVEFLDCSTTSSFLSPGGNDGRARLIRNGSYVGPTASVFGNASCVFGASVTSATGASGNIWQPLTTGLSNFLIEGARIIGSTDGYFMTSAVALNNVAAVDNLVERIGSTATPLAEISSANFTNLLFRGNTFVGQRFNHENDWATPHNFTCVDYVFQQNILSARGNHRADLRTPGNSTLTGFWPVDTSVGCWGNFNEGISSSGEQDFWGLNSNQPVGGAVSFGSPVAAGFLSDQSHDGSGVGAGNYRLGPRSGAIVLGVPTPGVFPFTHPGGFFFGL
jgi:hypothetical protein